MGWPRVTVFRFRETKDSFQLSIIQDRIKLELRRKVDVLRNKLLIGRLPPVPADP